MHNEPIQTGAGQSGGPQLREAFERLVHTALWQPRLGRELTREDARQIVENVTGFFSILHEWSKANDNDNRESSAATGSGEARRDR